MFAQLSMWVLAAALVQAEPEPAWLKAVPGDVDMVIRTRGLETTREHLTTMLTAMSPSLGESAGPALKQQLVRLRGTFGAVLAEAPCAALIRVVQPGANGALPIAVLVQKDDYAGVLRSVAGGNAVTPKPREGGGGYDTFEAGGNGTWYAVKGPGFVAFGPDETLIASVARPKDPTFAKTLTPALAEPFLAGDLGVFVNAAALTTRYADAIAQAREAMMASLDQAGQQAGNQAAMNAAKSIYGPMFDSLKYADALTLGLVASKDEARLSGALAIKPGSDAAKSIATSRTGSADALGKLPGDAALYFYGNWDAKSFEQAQNLSMRMLDVIAPGSPELKRAQEQFHGLGTMEFVGATGGAGGMQSLNIINVSDPKAFLAASRAMILAVKPRPGAPGFYKDVKLEERAQSHRGFTFDHAVQTLDLTKFPGPNAGGGAAGAKAAFGGDTINTWSGTDGKRVIQVFAASWADARARIDAYLDGKSAIGSTAGFKDLRSRLPEQVSMLFLGHAQGLVRMFASQLAAAAGNPAKPAAEPGGEPVFLGVSLTPKPPLTYEFHFVMPTSAGPVLEKGLGPVLQGLPGRPGQQ